MKLNNLAKQYKADVQEEPPMAPDLSLVEQSKTSVEQLDGSKKERTVTATAET
jgi:hypothetical protein